MRRHTHTQRGAVAERERERRATHGWPLHVCCVHVCGRRKAALRTSGTRSQLPKVSSKARHFGPPRHTQQQQQHHMSTSIDLAHSAALLSAHTQRPLLLGVALLVFPCSSPLCDSLFPACVVALSPRRGLSSSASLRSCCGRNTPRSRGKVGGGVVWAAAHTPRAVVCVCVWAHNRGQHSDAGGRWEKTGFWLCFFVSGESVKDGPRQAQWSSAASGPTRPTHSPHT